MTFFRFAMCTCAHGNCRCRTFDILTPIMMGGHLLLQSFNLITSLSICFWFCVVFYHTIWCASGLCMTYCYYLDAPKVISYKGCDVHLKLILSRQILLTFMVMNSEHFTNCYVQYIPKYEYMSHINRNE